MNMNNAVTQSGLPAQLAAFDAAMKASSVLSINGRPISTLFLEKELDRRMVAASKTKRHNKMGKGVRGAKKRYFRELTHRTIAAQQTIEKAFRKKGWTWRDVEKSVRSDPLFPGFRNLEKLARREGLVAA